MIDFEFNESQKMILSSLEKTLNENFDIRSENKKVEGLEYSNHGWEEIKNLGFLGILSDEKNGGLELSFFDFLLTLESWGNKLCEGPYIENSIVIFMLEKFNKNLQNSLVKDLSSSKKIITSIVSEQLINSRNIPILNRTNNGFVVNGQIKNLPYFMESTNILSIALLDNEKKLLLLDKKSTEVINKNKTITGQILHDVKIEKLELSNDRVLDSKKFNLPEIYLQLFTLSKCAESVGIADAILSMTNHYLKTREQFNKPLGSFQAIQHIASEIYIKLSETRELVRYCGKLSIEDKKTKKLISLSKIKCDEELSKIAWTSHQLHGAIGFTWDYGLHLMTRKILLNKSLNGDPLFHSKNQFI